MCEPKCPLCGAKSTWVRFPDADQSRRPDLRNRFPEDCKYCRQEDHVHWQQWEEGIDVTQFGGKSFDARVAIPGGKPNPHRKGVKLA